MFCIFFLGMINFGMGFRYVNIFLTVCDISLINYKIIVKKENIIGQVIEEEVKKFCVRLFEEEI